jgi:hypothetical protein
MSRLPLDRLEQDQKRGKSTTCQFIACHPRNIRASVARAVSLVVPFSRTPGCRNLHWSRLYVM